MKQYEDRKKVVAAIYLNTMSSKHNSNADARERQRRRQSESGVLSQPPKQNLSLE